MQSPSAMSCEIKSLLTLWLLKTGTAPQEIQTALQIAATWRAMAAEEPEQWPQSDGWPQSATGNVTKIRPTSKTSLSREEIQNFNTTNSEIKALVTLSLLKIGTTANEIQIAVRLAGASRADAAKDKATALRAASAAAPRVVRTVAALTPTPKQVVRNVHLAPIAMRECAAG
jgi:hypothetical protein